MRRLSALALLASLVLAGCTGGGAEGGDAEPAATFFDKGPTAEELARAPGSIEGVVTTPSLAPIGGAAVRLVRENLSTLTDAGGFFRFADLPTTSYLVEASAAGYATRTVVAAARNGTVLELNLTLEPAVVEAPRHETRELAGFLSCGVLVQGPDGATHGADCAAADPNHRDAFEFDVAPAGKTVVLELAWDPSKDPGVPVLRLVVETVGYGAMDETLAEGSGEGYVRLVVPQAAMEKFYPEGGRLRARVAMAPGEATPQAEAAAQTSFTVYVTAFYVEPAPEGFGVVTR